MRLYKHHEVLHNAQAQRLAVSCEDGVFRCTMHEIKGDLQMLCTPARCLFPTDSAVCSARS